MEHGTCRRKCISEVKTILQLPKILSCYSTGFKKAVSQCCFGSTILKLKSFRVLPTADKLIFANARRSLFQFGKSEGPKAVQIIAIYMAKLSGIRTRCDYQFKVRIGLF